MEIRDDVPLAVVTGASTGIGEALAHEFAQHGFDVVVAADEDRVDEVATELAATGQQVTPVRVDLSPAAGVEGLWATVTGLGRPPAAAALNAGVGVSGRFDQTSLDDDLGLIDL